jgi:hypothetical protein
MAYREKRYQYNASVNYAVINRVFVAVDRSVAAQAIRFAMSAPKRYRLDYLERARMWAQAWYDHDHHPFTSDAAMEQRVAIDLICGAWHATLWTQSKAARALPFDCPLPSQVTNPE